MKVKTWIRRYMSSTCVEGERTKKILIDNGVYDFSTYKEQIINVDLKEIVDKCKSEEKDYAGFRYSNRLYDFIHNNTIFIGERDDLEYEIIEEGYPSDIPYADCEFDNVEEFHEWLLKEGTKEREELNEG